MDEFLRLDDLQLGGTKIYQDKRMFCFGVDAVLLANYVFPKTDDRLLDLCTGNGIIPFIIASKKHLERIDCIDILKRNFELINMSIKENKMENTIFPILDDLNNSLSHYEANSFDFITCNPPYIKCGGGLQNPNDEKRCARHEVFCTLDNIISVSAKLLKQGGKLALVYRPERLAELIFTMKNYKIEPKRMRLVHSRQADKAKLVLIEGAKLGGTELTVEPPLYIYKNETEYSDEINEIYGRIQVK